MLNGHTITMNINFSKIFMRNNIIKIPDRNLNCILIEIKISSEYKEKGEIKTERFCSYKNHWKKMIGQNTKPFP